MAFVNLKNASAVLTLVVLNGTAPRVREEYHLTALALDADGMALNGQQLSTALQPLPPLVRPAAPQPLTIAALSYGFVQLPDVHTSACAG